MFLWVSLLVCVSVLLSLSVAASQPEQQQQQQQQWSVVFGQNGYEVKAGLDSSADAYGTYYRNYNGSYWNYFDGHMQTEVASVEGHLEYQRALGVLEGYATCQELHTFWPNFYSAVFGTDRVGAQTLAFIRENYEWMRRMANENASQDDYWYTIKATLEQLQGLLDGYKLGCGGRKTKQVSSHAVGNPFATLDEPTLEHFLLLQAWGDLYQITLKYVEPGKDSRFMGNKRVKGEQLKLIQRCSAVVKLFADKSDVSFGHATWDTYESLGPRIFKHYNLALMRGGYAEHHYDVYFSSSPGLISSIDDFFTVSGYAQLGVIETTNNLYNLKLLDLVVPQSVLSWVRSTTSNQMAKTGADWATNFARYQSGTYTNQWMVMDLNLFTPGSDPKPGFLTVTEEVPGLVHTADMTSTLIADSYWGSYNNPYFTDISEASGYAALCSRDSTECYNTCPRANLFREYQSQVQDVEGTQWILSYNSFQNDSASLNDSCNTIACRGDLEPQIRHRGAYGALDAKVSSAVNAKRYPGVPPTIVTRLGPTKDQQPVFCWSQLTDESDYVHNGQPDCFDFDWVSFPPKA